MYAEQISVCDSFTDRAYVLEGRAKQASSFPC